MVSPSDPHHNHLAWPIHHHHNIKLPPALHDLRRHPGRFRKYALVREIDPERKRFIQLDQAKSESLSEIFLVWLAPEYKNALFAFGYQLIRKSRNQLVLNPEFRSFIKRFHDFIMHPAIVGLEFEISQGRGHIGLEVINDFAAGACLLTADVELGSLD